MKYDVLDILGDLSMISMTNEVILIEAEQESPCMNFMSGQNNIIFCPSDFTADEKFDSSLTIASVCDSISKVHKILTGLNRSCDPFDFIVIHRIDMFDIHLDKMKRGALISGFISMLCSKNILRGANLVITSLRNEYTLREISTYTYTI